MRIILGLHILICASKISGTREKRTLIFPASAQIQWISSFGIPVDIELPVYVGYRITQNTYLPTTVEDLLPLYTWEGLDRNRRDVSGENVKVNSDAHPEGSNYNNVEEVSVEEGPQEIKESLEDDNDDNVDYQVEKDTIAARSYWNGLQDSEDEKQSPDSFRWNAYLMMEGITNHLTIGGKHCILRIICESAGAPISHSSGIFGELLHILLTPSSSIDTVFTPEHQEYVDAEIFGRDGHRPCAEEYPACTKSLLDIVSTFNNPFETLFKTYS